MTKGIKDEQQFPHDSKNDLFTASCKISGKVVPQSAESPEAKQMHAPDEKDIKAVRAPQKEAPQQAQLIRERASERARSLVGSECE